jgi:hypothetical protein
MQGFWKTVDFIGEIVVLRDGLLAKYYAKSLSAFSYDAHSIRAQRE